MSYQKFAKDIGLSALTQLIVKLQAVFVLPLITKLLGAEYYGIWVQLMITIGLISPIAVLGLPYTLVRFLPGEKDEREIKDGIWSVLFMVLVASLIISLFLILFSNPISSFIGGGEIFVYVLAMIILFECLNQVLWNIFRAFQQIKRYSFFTIFQTIGNIALIGISIHLGYGLLGAITSLLIMNIVSFLLMIALVIRNIGIKKPEFLKTKKYLSFSLPTILGNISIWTLQSSDRYIISFFMGAFFVGYYSSAYTLGAVIMFFVTPLSFVLPAILANFYDNNKINEVRIYLRYSIKYFLVIAVPSFFGLIALSKQILAIFSTHEISQNSYYIVPFVALSMLLLGVSIIISEITSLKKKTHISSSIWMIAAIINLSLNFIFIPFFGILGAAITTLVAYSFAFFATYYYSYKELSFSIDGLSLLKSIISSVPLVIISLYFNPLGLWRTLATITVAAAAYFTSMFLLSAFNKKEIELAKNLFLK